MMILYQCPHCGREAGVADFLKSALLICRCGKKMDQVAYGEEATGDKEYLQLRLGDF